MKVNFLKMQHDSSFYKRNTWLRNYFQVKLPILRLDAIFCVYNGLLTMSNKQGQNHLNYVLPCTQSSQKRQFAAHHRPPLAEPLIQ